MKKIYFFIVILLSTSVLWGQQHHDRYNSIDVQHYRFELELNDSTDIIYGKTLVNIKFKKATGSFDLDLQEMIDSTGKGMIVTSVFEGESETSFRQNANKLIIDLLRTSTPDDQRDFTITYHGIPSDGLYISQNKYGDRTFFGDNWPNRAWYWIPTVDHPSDKATVEWIIYAPDHYQVVGNGRQIEETNLEGGKKLTHWKMDVRIPTKVMVIGVARFGVQYLGDAVGTPVTSWVYPQNKLEGFQDYSMGVEIMEYFIDKIAPYPYEKLANVQSKTRFGGMENASNIFYSERSVSGTIPEFLFAHEIAHQWFGNSASEMNWHHVWLSEGFATYMTHLYAESTRDRIFLQERMKQDRQRIIQFHSRRPIAIIDTTITDYFRLLNTNSYQKGGWVLHMLRKELGDDNFWKGIREYYQRYKFGNALSEDLQEVMEEISGKNLKNFFQQWLYQPGHPVLKMDWQQTKNKALIDIEQIQKIPFSVPLEIEIKFQDGSTVKERIQLEHKSQSFTFKVKKPILKIEMDPDVQLLWEPFVTDAQ